MTLSKLISAGAGAILLVFGLLYGLSGLADIDAGETGILIKKVGENRGMQKETMDTGLHWVDPIKYDVTVYDVRLRQYDIKNLPAQSKDGQPLVVDVSLEIGLIDAKVPFLHETIGPNWYQQVVYPKLRTILRDETAAYASDAIYTDEGRKGIHDRTESRLRKHVEPYGINVAVNLRDLAFTNNQFTATLERKAQAAQDVIIAQRRSEEEAWNAEKVAATAEGAKQKAIKEAEAERERMKLEGEGARLRDEEIAKGMLALKKAEAEGNRLQVMAFGDGQTYASVKWAEYMGPNVKVLGYPLGAEGTTGLFNVDGILGSALKIGQ